MNLIYCPACGKQVSADAAACPYCGQPVAKKKSNALKITLIVGGILLAGGLVLGAILLGLALMGGSSQPTPAPPVATANFQILNVHSDESCTELGDYCVRAFCNYINKGDAPGEKVVTAELRDNDVSVGSRQTTLTLLPEKTQELMFDFKEAELGDEHHYKVVCKTE